VRFPSREAEHSLVPFPLGSINARCRISGVINDRFPLAIRTASPVHCLTRTVIFALSNGIVQSCDQRAIRTNMRIGSERGFFGFSRDVPRDARRCGRTLSYLDRHLQASILLAERRTIPITHANTIRAYANLMRTIYTMCI
jgi:hypothetical protein